MTTRRHAANKRQQRELAFLRGSPVHKMALGEIADVWSGIPVLGSDTRDSVRLPAIRLANLAAPLGALRAASFRANRVERAQVCPGDVLVAGRGTQLHATVVPNDLADPRPVATESVLIVRGKDMLLVTSPEVLPEVLALLLGPGGFAKRLAGPTRTIGLAHSLSVEALREWQVPIPPMELQVHAAEVFASTRRAIVAAEGANHARRELLAAMARDLSGGDVER